MRTTPRNPLLLNLVEKGLASSADWIFDQLNDYHNNATIRQNTILSFAITITITIAIAGTIRDSEVSRYDYSASSYGDDRFQITNFETGCIPKNEGHQALLRLTNSFEEARVINYGTSNGLVFNGVTGEWAMFALIDTDLCHVFSGVNFTIDGASTMQNERLSYFLGEDYLGRVQPAIGNLITFDAAA